jgi:multisubunit Na+/H+ antiporter MnhG subunit
MNSEMFPLLSFSFVVYTALTLLLPEHADGAAWHEWVITTLPLYSHDQWTIKWGDLFIVTSMGLLFVELVRATKTGTASITNHLLSFLLFIIVLLAFILAPGFGNSVFFIFLTMTLLDPMAGFIVTTVTARRDLTVGDKAGFLS